MMTRSTFVLLAGAMLLAGCQTAQAPADSDTGGKLVAVDRERVAIVLVDAQPTFWRSMVGEREPVEARLEQLLLLASMTRIPLIATFEYPTESNGWLPERLETVFPEHGERFVKQTFNCCGEEEIRAAAEELRRNGVEQIALAGAETDVCVLQSAFGLQDLGFQVFLLEDCIFTNEPNTAPAIRRMYDGGIIPSTYKTFFYEVMRSVDRGSYPPEWRERRGDLPVPLRSPYQLPPWNAAEARGR